MSTKKSPSYNKLSNLFYLGLILLTVTESSKEKKRSEI